MKTTAIQQKKIDFLLKQGGKVREVKVWIKKPDNTVCTVDKFGRVNWLKEKNIHRARTLHSLIRTT